MFTTTIVMGWLGVAFLLAIAFSFQPLLRHNESGFLHLLMAFMYACWLPFPFVTYFRLGSPSFLWIGAMLGTLALALFVFTMVLQAGHLSYSAKKFDEHPNQWESRDNWMLHGLLGSQVEVFAGLLKGIWILFLTIAFWLNGDILMGIIGIVFSCQIIFFIFRLLDLNIVKPTPFFQSLRLNSYILNLEVAVWFTVLTLCLCL